MKDEAMLLLYNRKRNQNRRHRNITGPRSKADPLTLQTTVL